MMQFFLTQFRSLFGGGATYIFAAFGAALLFQYWQVNDLKAKQEDLIRERDAAIAQNQEKDTVIASQSRQFHRQTQSRKDEANAENIINSVPDSHQCIRSASVNNAIAWLRQHEDASAKTNPDGPDVSMPREAGAAD